jgi:dienelactone hydrolase
MRFVQRLFIVALCCIVAVQAPRAQDEATAVANARHIIELLRQEKFEDVARDFTPQMTAAMSVKQLGDLWTRLRGQVGALTSIIDDDVAVNGAITGVTMGCQFERAALNVRVAFRPDGKIAGLGFTPRRAAVETSVPPPSSRFTEESIVVGSGEWALPGTLSLPPGDHLPAIALVHGSGAGDRDETVGANKPFRDLAWGLADRGIAVVRYDKRTRQYGAKMALNKNLTVQDETIDDAVLAATLLRAHARIDRRRVFILGHSLGGTLAPRIAAQDRDVAGLVIMAGATRPFDDTVKEQLAYLASLTPGGSAADQEAAFRQLKNSAPPAYWTDLDAYHPAQIAATLTIPMLILQGERDYQVTLQDLAGWRKALDGHAGVVIKTYPTLNHLFLTGEGKSVPSEYARPGTIPGFVLDDIANWIKNAPALRPGR